MCDDCQAYAHYLGRAGEILDAHGGTDMFQTTPSQIEIATGIEHVRCVRLSEAGILRWFAGCCRTPMAHTVASPNVPFVGVPHTFMDHRRETRDEALGPVVARVRGRFGRGPLPPDAHRGVPLRALARGYGLMFWAWIRGLHAPSPFFDPRTGRPRVEPIVLSRAERDALGVAGDAPACG
jgi:hypothetical protein